MKLLLHACTLTTLLFLTGCGPAYIAQSQAESKIRSSFGTLKEALARGDRAAIIRHLSPGTMAMFSSARSFGLDPDSVDTDKLSQLEVLIGLQARWLLGMDALATRSPADLFEWGVQNGIVHMGALSTVNLANIRTEGHTATAYMTTGGTVMTNAVLSFASHGGRWTLELDKILLAPEPQLAAVRAERNMSKPELAVAILEGMYKQPIPSVREFLLTPKVRKQVAALKNKPASGVYDAVIEELSAGRQSDAEDILDVFVAVHTNDQRLAFAQATCSRSRWSKMESGWQFRRVLELDPSTPEGNCARYMLDLDARRNVDANMQALRFLASNNKNDPLIRWLMAIECRDYYKLTGNTTYSKEAEQCYRRLIEVFDVGPVLLHQTFANVLSEELNMDEEALKHRRIAVQLEPKTWTYQGLANTLSVMKRYDEANEAYAKLVELDPHDADYWRNWAGSLSRQGRHDDCIEKSTKALECDPSSFEAYNGWGYALEQLGKPDEALEKFNKAIDLNPAHAYAYDAAVRVLNKMGRGTEAQAMLSRKTEVARGMGTSGDRGKPDTQESEQKN